MYFNVYYNSDKILFWRSSLSFDSHFWKVGTKVASNYPSRQNALPVIGTTPDSVIFGGMLQESNAFLDVITCYYIWRFWTAKKVYKSCTCNGYSDQLGPTLENVAVNLVIFVKLVELCQNFSQRLANIRKHLADIWQHLMQDWLFLAKRLSIFVKHRPWSGAKARLPSWKNLGKSFRKSRRKRCKNWKRYQKTCKSA